MRSLMLAGSSGGMSRYLKLFYFAPMSVFLALGPLALLADAAGVLSSAKPVHVKLRVLLLLGSGATAALLAVLYRLSGRVGARAVASSLGLESVADVVQQESLLRTIEASHRARRSPAGVGSRESGVGPPERNR